MFMKYSKFFHGELQVWQIPSALVERMVKLKVYPDIFHIRKLKKYST